MAAGLLDNPFTGGGAFALARYNSRNGRLDSSFDLDGKVTTVLGEEAAAQGVLVSPGGRIVAAGAAQLEPGQGDRFVLTRYLVNGALDAGFGQDGVAVTTLPGGDALANAIAQRNGRLVAVGQANQPDGKTLDLRRCELHAERSARFGVWQGRDRHDELWDEQARLGQRCRDTAQRADCRRRRDGDAVRARALPLVVAAICMAVGNLSLLD